VTVPPRQALDKILESTIVQSWSELSESRECNSMQVNYEFSLKGDIDSLALWLSIARGHWYLVCRYGLHTDNSVQFQNGYRSADLARNLDLIMKHQDNFLPLHNYGRAGLLQIQKPTQEEVDMARELFEAYLKIPETTVERQF
jgi:hypothetical protein